MVRSTKPPPDDAVISKDTPEPQDEMTPELLDLAKRLEAIFGARSTGLETGLATPSPEHWTEHDQEWVERREAKARHDVAQLRELFTRRGTPDAKQLERIKAGMAELFGQPLLEKRSVIAAEEVIDYNKQSPQTERKDEGAVNALLQKITKEFEKLPQTLWPRAAAAIERALEKVAEQATERPLWNDRAHHPELANLTPPEFLKLVWHDKINKRGVVEANVIKDSVLLARVSGYVAKRKFQGQKGLGKAEGLTVVKKKPGRPKKKSKINTPRHSLK